MANNRKPPYKWLVMIYMASNDKYSQQAARKFLKELSAVGTELKKSDKVKIMLLSMGNWSPPGRKRRYYSRHYEVQRGFLKKKRLTLDILNANLGDKAILIDFIDRCKERYTAEKHLLLLWGHGTGTSMFDEQLKESKKNIKHLKEFLEVHKSQEPPKTDDEYFDDKFIERQIKYPTEKTPIYLFYLNVAKHHNLKWFLPNKARLDSLRAKEIAQSLKSCFGKNRGKIDIVAILGCTMQMVEFGYEIRKHCKYLVASEELMFWEGYNYKRTFLDLVKNPSMDACQLGKNLVLDTVQKPSYTKKDKKEIAISCVDLQLSHQLARHIDSISKDLLNELKTHPELLDILAESRLKCYHFGEDAFNSYVDVTWYFITLVRYLKRFYGNKKLIKKAEFLIEFLEDKYIVEKYIGKSRAPYVRPIASTGGHGISIYFPFGRKDRYDNHILGVPFIKGSPFQVEFVKNKWNDLVSAIIDRLKSNPQKRDKRL